jgi:hypothetical protein
VRHLDTLVVAHHLSIIERRRLLAIAEAPRFAIVGCVSHHVNTKCVVEACWVNVGLELHRKLKATTPQRQVKVCFCDNNNNNVQLMVFWFHAKECCKRRRCDTVW